MKKPSPWFIAFLVLDAALLIFVLVVFCLPGHFRTERSITVAAPAATVFAEVNDFHRWQAWSPWAKIDPRCTQTYAGEPAGVNAVYSWSGNDDVGEGRMRIQDTRPPSHIAINIDFLRPFQATNQVEFSFVPTGASTRVTWSMTGDRNFICKIFALFVDLDALVGGDFEKGLLQLKTVSEAAAAPVTPKTAPSSMR